MNDLVFGEMVWGLPLLMFENDHLCDACECGNKSKKGIPVIVEQSISEPLELMYIDLWGPSTIESMCYKKYILVIVDDYTRFTWVFFLKLKSETALKLINFINGIEVLVKIHVRRIWSDNALEFTNVTIKKFLSEKASTTISLLPTLLKKTMWLKEETEFSLKLLD